jgi:hypothetical protein
VDLTFNYLASDVMGTESTYKIIRVTGATPIVWPNSAADAINHQATTTGVSSFSDWTLATPSAPTASSGAIVGRIIDDSGLPIAGAVVRLDGAQTRKTITDANGNYRFSKVETTGFYTVTPSRVDYNFNPFNRSLSQLDNQTEAVFGGSFTGDALNPLDTPEYFVRQQYVDVLGREPDEAGFNFWSDRILVCGNRGSPRGQPAWGWWTMQPAFVRSVSRWQQSSLSNRSSSSQAPSSITYIKARSGAGRRLPSTPLTGGRSSAVQLWKPKTGVCRKLRPAG